LITDVGYFHKRTLTTKPFFVYLKIVVLEKEE
jgi:hypothetical protein